MKGQRNLLLIAVMTVALSVILTALVYAQEHPGVTLTNGPLQLLFVDEAASVADYVDDTAEPEGWILHHALFWEGEGKLDVLSPSVHFSHNGTERHFWPLHQSLLQDPGDPTVLSSGWVISPTAYRAAVEDADGLVRLEHLVTIPVSNTVVHTFIITAQAALNDVRLIVYGAFDMNAPLFDYGEVTVEGLRVLDTLSLLQMELTGETAPDGAEVGSWNDGPGPGDDVWQHALAGSLGDTVTATQYVEGALAFNLGDFAPGQAGSEVITLTVHINTPPVAAFTVTPTEGSTETIFTCDASASSDAEDPPEALEVRWDFEDDGVYDTSFTTAKVITHTYATAGLKTIRLQVRDTKGLTDTVTHTVNVFEIYRLYLPLAVRD
mgnify:CR=1 FL=1